MSESGKQYGLILPKKGLSQGVIQRPSIFTNESDSDDSGQGEKDWRKKTFQSDFKTAEKRQTKLKIEKALNEDPSIYHYDEVYDEMKEKTTVLSTKKDDKKQSRYIQSLKKNAERRKLENERRMERQVQKERKEEGEQFKDKETFVTASYKKKLEEFQKMEEEEKRMDRLEEIGDVTKQQDISGFYRHLYASTVSKEEPTSNKQNKQKKEQEENESLSIEQAENSSKPSDNIKKQRQYRKRTKSASSKEEGEKTSTSGSSSDESDNEQYVKKPVKRERKMSFDETIVKVDKPSPAKDNISAQIKLAEDKITNKEILETNNQNEKVSKVVPPTEELTSKENMPPIENHPKPVANIWLKRTVGNHFEAALQRYLERKSKRQSGY